MKKDYQSPQCKVIDVAITKHLLEGSTVEEEGSGNGNPDSRKVNVFWDEE